MDVSPIGPARSHGSCLSDKQLANEPGIEPVPCDPVHFCRQCGAHWNGEKTIVTSSVHQIDIDNISTPSDEVTQQSSFKERCMGCYRKHPRLRWILLSAITFVIAIIIALAIHFRPRHHPAIPPPTGILRNGTGLVVLDRGDESTTVDIFFQHESGQIRHAVFDSDKKQWTLGGLKDNVLSPYAPLPRPGTPLMAVSYKIGNEITWRVFYIDSSDLLQESVASTTTADQFPSTWSTGPLGLGAYKAHSSPHTGISVCTNMMWSPDPEGYNNGSLVLFYGSADGTNQMLTHEAQDTAWSYDHTFQDSSAASGVECTCRQDEIVDTWMFDTKGQLLQASFNSNPRSNNTAAYPVGHWVNGTIYGEPIQNSTSISAIKYTGNISSYEESTFVYFVLKDNTITGLNVDTANRSLIPARTNDWCTIGDSPIVSGSKFAGVLLHTNQLVSSGSGAEAHGEDGRVFIQALSNPTQVSIMSGNFADDDSLFAQVGNGSNIQT